MSLYTIPVTNDPQTFQISLAEKNYICTCKFNSAADGGWVLDFLDFDTSEPIVANIPLITGTNLLAGLDYLGFGGKLYVKTDGSDYAVPTYENLGVESFLYFEVEDV